MSPWATRSFAYLPTSSAAAQDYANGTTPQARSDAYVSGESSSKHKSDDTKDDQPGSDDDGEVQRLTQEGLDQLAQGASKLFDASSVKAKEWSQSLGSASDDALNKAKSSASDALAALSAAAQDVSNALQSKNQGSKSTNADSPGVVAQSSSAQAALEAGNIPLSNAPAPDNADLPSSLAMVRTDYQLDLKQINPDLSGPNLPAHLALSFEHPKELKESFMVAGSDVIIAFGNEDGNFQVSLKVHPLDAAVYQRLTMDDLKQDITHRFTDKANMLYGQYEVTQELSDHSQGSPFLDLSILSSLKKGEDGILPDLQSYFYERNVVERQYHATLSCELRGRQVQASIVEQRFALIKPLCERVINSLSLKYSD